MIDTTNINELRAILSQSMDEKAFAIVDVALCGHMTHKQQQAFLKDIENRGLIK